MKLNGRPVTELGTRATPHDRVTVDGKPVEVRREPLHILLHKPAGVVTTLRDPEGRPTVRALLPRELPRVFPVGRLDVQSTGLLLLTNDGELAARVTHPRHHVARTYRVKVRGRPDARALLRLRRGVRALLSRVPLWLLVAAAAFYNITAIADSSVYSTAITELVPPQYLGAAYALRSLLGFGWALVLLVPSFASARPFRVSEIPNGSDRTCRNCHGDLTGGTMTDFGSAARGDCSPDSDADFLIIKRDCPDLGASRIRELQRLIAG